MHTSPGAVGLPIRISLAAALLALAGGAAQAQNQRIFRCAIQGHVVFQQSACPAGGDAKVIDVRPGSVVVAPQRPPAAASAPPQRAAASAPMAKSALEPIRR